MAIAIKSIPILENKVASNFVENARLSSKKEVRLVLLSKLKQPRKFWKRQNKNKKEPLKATLYIS
jgi:hypothetical protein